MSMTTAAGAMKKDQRGTPPDPDQWDAWAAYLSRRKHPRPLADRIGDKRSPALLWPLCAEFPESNSAELVAYLHGFKPRAKGASSTLVRRLEPWLDAATDRQLDPLWAIECLAWTHALPRLAEILPAAPWCQLLETLSAVVSRADDLDRIADPLTHQLLCGELPLTIACQLPELEAARGLAEPSAATLSAAILELLDGEGLPHCRHLDLLRPLLACWTRCIYVAREAGVPCFDEDAAAQYAWMVRETLRFSRADGSQVLADPIVGFAAPSLWLAALEAIDSDADPAIAARVIPALARGGKKKAASSGRRDKASKLPPPAVHSEWAATAMLRRNWDRDGDSLAVAYGGHRVQLELNCGRETVWSGGWEFAVAVDGRPLQVVDELTQVCWVADDDVDYLEVEAQLGDGWRLQRQILLAGDRFLFLADALLGVEMHTIEFRSTLPLCPDVHFEPADETCEGMLRGRRPLARVLPIDLPEWRTQSTGDAIEQVPAGLQLSRCRQASRLFSAWFIDLEPRRMKKEPTWRQLTVAQQLERQTDDMAVGYRVQIGKDQWLVYRSLGPKANRTVLGQNYNTDFVVARFTPLGGAVKLLEIE